MPAEFAFPTPSGTYYAPRRPAASKQTTHGYEIGVPRLGAPMTDQILCAGCMSRSRTSGAAVELSRTDWCDACGCGLGPSYDA